MLYHGNINKNQPGMSKLLTDKIEGREEGGKEERKSGRKELREGERKIPQVCELRY